MSSHPSRCRAGAGRAGGLPAQVHPPKIKGCDQVRDGVGVVGHAHLRGGSSEPPQRGASQAITSNSSGRPREVRSPLPPVAPRAVQQQERVSAAAAPVAIFRPPISISSTVAPCRSWRGLPARRRRVDVLSRPAAVRTLGGIVHLAHPQLKPVISRQQMQQRRLARSRARSARSVSRP